MSSFVRSSKFRHVYCDNPKLDQTYQNLRLSTVTGEQNYIKANPLFFAVGLQGGGGPFTVHPLSKPGRVESENLFVGHSAPVLDFDFNPFHDHIIASASEDMTVKIWAIPEKPQTENIHDPLVDLSGHSRKVTLLRFHPTANNVLASVGGDQSVKLWDIQKGCEMASLNDAHEQLIQDIVWDHSGNTYATSCKDKHVRIFDARTSKIAANIETAHEGAKSTKLTYTGQYDRLITVGFTRQSQRQFKIWDPRNTSQEIKKFDIDQAAGVIMPFFDPDTGILYLAGKGDGNVRYFEIVHDNAHLISDMRSNVSAKGMAWVPKRGMNVLGCEVARLLKLTTNGVEPLSFIVPRKSEAFQEDIFPDTASIEPSHSADDWMSGSDQPPKLASLNPAIARSTPAVVSTTSFAPVKTPAMLQAELNAANLRIKELENRLAAAGLNVE